MIFYILKTYIVGTHLLESILMEKKKDNKQYLLDTPHTVDWENYYQEYKGNIKWLSLISSHFAKKNFGMTLLHAHAHYICIVCAKYHKTSVKALYKLISSCMHYLSKSYLIGNRK